MRFSEFVYKRPDLEQFKVDFEKTVADLRKAKTFQEADLIVKQLNKMREDFSTASSICMIRYCMNTNDEFYKAEKDFFDTATPVVEGLTTLFYRNPT